MKRLSSNPVQSRPAQSRLAQGSTMLLLAGTALAWSPSLPAQSLPLNPLPPALSAAPRGNARHGRHAAKDPAPKQPDTPNISIPVTPLGFAPPAPFYLGDRVAQVSLNFLDEETLLFTFRVPGLIAREQPAPGNSSERNSGGDERNIRALVLSLPTGKVMAESLWRLHDYAPYLWVLKDRQFLLRDRNLLQTGDAVLHLEPFLRFPGPVKYVEFDPEQRLLVADTSEIPAPEANAQVASLPSTTAAGTMPQANPPLAPEMQSLLRILRMDSREVMLFSRVPGIQHMALDGDGYYEALRANGRNWLVSYRDFAGVSLPILEVESTCYPTLDVPAAGIVLASACVEGGGRELLAFRRHPEKSLAVDRNAHAETHPDLHSDSHPDSHLDPHLLWQSPVPPTHVWPLVAHSASGLRLARSTLDVTHPIGRGSPLDNEDIRGQNVQVYDVATGNSPISLSVSPILDAGGNFALSPSGNRLAVLNAGAIQVYDLPPVAAATQH